MARICEEQVTVLTVLSKGIPMLLEKFQVLLGDFQASYCHSIHHPYPLSHGSCGIPVPHSLLFSEILLSCPYPPFSLSTNSPATSLKSELQRNDK
jgi:hypothetical protein